MYLWIYYFAPVITNDSQRSYSFGKTQNVEVPELSQEKKFNVSLQKDFVFCFHTHTHTHTHTQNIFGFAEDILWRRQKE